MQKKETRMGLEILSKNQRTEQAENGSALLSGLKMSNWSIHVTVGYYLFWYDTYIFSFKHYFICFSDCPYKCSFEWRDNSKLSCWNVTSVVDVVRCLPSAVPILYGSFILHTVKADWLRFFLKLIIMG